MMTQKRATEIQWLLSEKYIVVSMVLLGALFYPPIKNLFYLWQNNGDYSHGFFVIPIFAYMVWEKKDLLINIEKETFWFAFPMFVVFSLIYVVSVIIKFHTLTYLSMILVIYSMIFYLGGWAFFKKMIMPVLFLVFMFPIPNSYYILITNPMKMFITSISAYLIDAIGISVYREGNLLFFANTSLEVAEACSGIRSLYSYIMIGCVFTMICKKNLSKIIILLSTIPLAIIVNIIRVTGTGILSHFYGSKAAQGFFHEFSGMVLFIAGLILLFGEYYVLENKFSK